MSARKKGSNPTSPGIDPSSNGFLSRKGTDFDFSGEMSAILRDELVVVWILFPIEFVNAMALPKRVTSVAAVKVNFMVGKVLRSM